MTPRRHRFWQSSARRPSLWLGLFIACFLTWAWWDSQRFETWGQAGGYTALRLEGSTFVIVGVLDPFEDFAVRRRRTASSAKDEEQFFALRAIPYLKVPDSLGFISFVGLWVGWLVWRRRIDTRRERMQSEMRE